MESQINALSVDERAGIAASYARTNESSITNLDPQEAACVARAEALGYVVPEDYRLRAVASGLDTDHPVLAELYQVVASQEVQCVVLYNLDRLSRVLVEVVKFLRHAQEHDVRVEFVNGSPLPEDLLAWVGGFLEK